MSLVRSFTTRLNKGSAESSSPSRFGRVASHRSGKPGIRGQISSPLALVSTSNVMLNNAQHIAGTHEIHLQTETPSSPGSSSSGEESDGTMSSFRSGYTATDASSVGDSPMENHLSCYFKPVVDTQATTFVRSMSNSTLSTVSETPSIPMRQPSHSKRAHETVHRQRSIRRALSPPESFREVSRTSAEIIGLGQSPFVEAPKDSPFGPELAQLDEVAEELGHVVRDAEASQDNVVMEAHGLAYFSACDYVDEIQGLLSETFYRQSSTVAGWI